MTMASSWFQPLISRTRLPRLRSARQAKRKKRQKLASGVLGLDVYEMRPALKRLDYAMSRNLRTFE